MELERGKVAVVTGAASGIGLALAERLAVAGMAVVLSDIEEDKAAEQARRLAGTHGVETLAVRTDVSEAAQVEELARAAWDRFGGVHLVCNNAGVAATADPWLGPLSAWEWVMGVNFWGVVHGVRAFLPYLVLGGGGHIVNTASMAGVFPGFTPAYDASKHAVVAVSEGLYTMLRAAQLPVGVSVLCPGWVRTQLMDAERNWPDELGAAPGATGGAGVMAGHVRRAIDEGMTPAAVADRVADAVTGNRFWVFPHADFLELAVRRWERIAEGLDPEPPGQIPGLPPFEQLLAEMQAAAGPDPAGS
ncbi:MAG: SDR family NAD(P)-dependent oxidoreductase [Acidimicrobiales bacterium]|jgi:NAD(P)-dependent dehydrogenase (short-subunit alcohol dehydrogenase family)|nr:SDR family NAD(P)-dependent oxidoreductase [Acidimicrobiales bacterium]